MAKAKKSSVPSTSVESTEVVATPEVVEVTQSEPSLMSQLVQQVVDAEPVKVEEVKSEKNEGVGQFIRKLIAEGLGNKEILSIVHEQYGNKNTTYACVAWYRNKMKKAGQDVKKSNALDFITNFAKANNLSEESVEVLKQEMKVA